MDGASDDFTRMSVGKARAELGLPAPPAPVSQDEVRRAFRKGALRCHPDKLTAAGGDPHEVASLFLRLHGAYRYLTQHGSKCPPREGGASPGTDGEDGFFSEDDPGTGYDPVLVRSLFFRALGGELRRESLEELLQRAGVHRPPSEFGTYPYPRFKELPKLGPRRAFPSSSEEPLFALGLRSGKGNRAARQGTLVGPEIR